MNTIELFHDISGVSTLWLNRPEQGNALTLAMIAQITDALEIIAADKQIRLLIVRGRGKNFCSGADLDEMRSSGAASVERNLADALQLSTLFQHLQQLSIPVIAIVQGAIFGGGAGLVCCADIAIGIADKNNPIRFCFSEVKLGLAPAIISPLRYQHYWPAAGSPLLFKRRTDRATGRVITWAVASISRPR